MKEIFIKEFERRLFRLRDAINRYEQTRNIGNVLPFLYKCLNYCWCKDPRKKN